MVDIRRGAGGIDTTGGRGFAGPGRGVARMAPDRVRAERVVSWADTSAPQFYRQVTDRLARGMDQLVQMTHAESLMRLDLDLKAKQVELEAAHEADPEGFERNWSAYAEARRAHLPEVLHEAYDRRAATRSVDSVARLGAMAIARKKEATRATLLSAAYGLTDELGQAALDGNEEGVRSSRELLAGLTDAGLVQGLLSGAEASSLRRAAQERQEENAGLGFLARHSGAASAGEGTPLAALAERVARQESGGRQFDAKGEPLTSPKGAVGVMQVTEGAGKEAAALLGIGWDEKRWKEDEDYNRTLGEGYLSMMLARYDEREVLALSGYNAGPGNTDFYIRETVAKHGPDFTDGQFVETVETVQKRVTAGRGGPARSETADYIRAITGAAPDLDRSPLGAIAAYREQATAAGLPRHTIERVAGRMLEEVERQQRIDERARRAAEAEAEARRAEVQRALAVGVLDGTAGGMDLRNALAGRQIDVAQYRTLREMMNAPPAERDDPAVAFDLQKAAVDGAPDVYERVNRAVAEGSITHDTAGRLWARADETVRRGGPLARDDVRRWGKHVAESLGGSGPFSTLDAPTAERVSLAQREYEDAILADPQQDPRATALRTIQRWRTEPQQFGNLPKPRFLALPNVEAVKEEDLGEAEAAALAAFESGQISAEEFANEIRSIEQMTQLLAERERWEKALTEGRR